MDKVLLIVAALASLVINTQAITEQKLPSVQRETGFTIQQIGVLLNRIFCRFAITHLMSLGGVLCFRRLLKFAAA